MMTPNDRADLREKLEEIAATLNYLNDKYQAQYLLHFLKIEDNKYTTNEIFFNPDINIADLEYMDYQTAIIQKSLNYLPSLLSSGRTVVICKDDSNKPDDFVGDWIKKGKIYVVIIMHKNEDGFYYEFENIKANLLGFNSTRFERIYPEHYLN